MNVFFPGYKGWTQSADPVPPALAALVPDISWDGTPQVMTQTLPFYPQAQFLMVRDPAWVPANLFIYALVKDGDVCWLNGTSPPLHAFNQQGHLSLSQETALAYLQFFSFFVRGEDGPFYVVDSPHAPYLPIGMRAGTETPETAQMHARFQERFQSPRAFSASPDGKWRFSTMVYYSNAVFIADFQVGRDGMVEMDGDFPLLPDLPHKIWAPIAGTPGTKPTLH